LFEEFVDFFRFLLEAVLDVDFAGSFTGKGGDELEAVAEVFFVLLRSESVIMSAKIGG
jgi:hypothetical protein